MDYSKCMCSSLTRVCTTKRNIGISNLNNYASISVKLLTVTLDLLCAFGIDSSLCLGIIVQRDKGFTTIAL